MSCPYDDKKIHTRHSNFVPLLENRTIIWLSAFSSNVNDWLFMMVVFLILMITTVVARFEQPDKSIVEPAQSVEMKASR